MYEAGEITALPQPLQKQKLMFGTQALPSCAFGVRVCTAATRWLSRSVYSEAEAHTEHNTTDFSADLLVKP